jgi:hypothetical protein
MRDETVITPPRVTWRTRWLVCGLAIFLILGHAFDAFTEGDHWPISSYPMYAYVNPHTFKLTRLFGVTDEQPPREIPLDTPWLRNTFNRILRRPADRDVRLRHAVENYAHTYGWTRPKDKAQLVAYRLYAHAWELRPDADPSRLPDASTLLVEMRREDVTATTATTPAATTTSAIGEVARDAAP